MIKVRAQKPKSVLTLRFDHPTLATEFPPGAPQITIGHYHGSNRIVIFQNLNFSKNFIKRPHWYASRLPITISYNHTVKYNNN